jgi:hypothetical protein
MVQISFNKVPTNQDRLGCRKKVDVEMANGPGSRGHFTPGFRNQPMNVLARFLPITEVAAENFSATD